MRLHSTPTEDLAPGRFILAVALADGALKGIPSVLFNGVDQVGGVSVKLFAVPFMSALWLAAGATLWWIAVQRRSWSVWRTAWHVTLALAFGDLLAFAISLAGLSIATHHALIGDYLDAPLSATVPGLLIPTLIQSPARFLLWAGAIALGRSLGRARSRPHEALTSAPLDREEVIHTSRTSALLVLIIAAASAGSLSAQQAIPIRHLTTVASTDSGVVRNVDAIHVQSDGQLLLNDGSRRRLLLFDSTLKRFTIVADTGAGAPVSYGVGGSAGGGNGAILPFAGDSVAFTDIPARSLTIVDARGHFGRITTPPVVGDMFSFASGTYGVPGFDSRGRLYYRVENRPQFKPDTGKEGADTSYIRTDSAAILRANFDERRVDTVAKLHAIQRLKVIRTMRATPNGYIGGYGMFQVYDPLPNTDEWAYLPDGTVAIVRGQDYHVDWYLPDGRRESTPKMPFDWRRITDEEKQRTIDSVRHRIDSAYDASVARLAKANPGRPAASVAGRVAHPEVVAASDLPDYYPPVRAGSQMRADPDGNLWILPTTSLQAKGGFLYDVVNRKGEIIERVQFPEGRALAGFGPKGVVYMQVPPGYAWARVERARIN